jgi:hypothetical protein
VKGNPELPYVGQVADFVGVEFPEITVSEGGVCLINPTFDLKRGIYSFIDLSSLGVDLTVSGFLSVMSNISPDRYKALWELIVFDVLVSRIQRDPLLVGVLQDNKTFELKSGIVSYCGSQTLCAKEKMVWPWGVELSYVAALSKVLGFGWVERLVNFEFEEIKGCGVSEEKLSIAGGLIRKNAEKLLREGSSVKGVGLNLF